MSKIAHVIFACLSFSLFGHIFWCFGEKNKRRLRKPRHFNLLFCKWRRSLVKKNVSCSGDSEDVLTLNSGQYWIQTNQVERTRSWSWSLCVNLPSLYQSLLSTDEGLRSIIWINDDNYTVNWQSSREKYHWTNRIVLLFPVDRCSKTATAINGSV